MGINCFKCGKRISRDDGGVEKKGQEVNLNIASYIEITPVDIEYLNRQLGKYSDGKGGCDVAICLECYIDKVFGVKEEGFVFGG